MNVPETHVLSERGPVSLLVRRDWVDDLPVEALLDGVALAGWGAGVDETLTSGRGQAIVLATPKGPIVAKQLTRGGVLGGLFRRTYFDRWRCLREAEVAERLVERGCPTPPVVVARATRVGWAGYRLELATAKVRDARDLYVALLAGVAVPPLVTAAGRSVAALHEAGLNHRDLTVENLLIGPDPGSALTVIDLDRCTLGPPLGRAARVASLARLARSAVKRGLAADHGGPLDAEACALFLAAYEEARGQLEPDLGPAVTRRVRRHLSFRSLRGRSGSIPSSG